MVGRLKSLPRYHIEGACSGGERVGVVGTLSQLLAPLQAGDNRLGMRLSLVLQTCVLPSLIASENGSVLRRCVVIVSP